MDKQSKKAVVDHLFSFITENKTNKINTIIEDRTNYVTVVVEDLYQPHNASAVMRSCDCFGVQTLHAIENQNKFSMNTEISVGANKWVDLKQHNELENNTLSTIKKLKDEGYRIVATTPHTNDCNINELDLSKGKMAFFFGTEAEGLTQEMMDNADEFVKIPMYGFTESFNISVSAALILNNVMTRLHDSDIDWRLSDDEKLDIKHRWVRNIVRRADDIEQDFLAKKEA